MYSKSKHVKGYDENSTTITRNPLYDKDQKLNLRNGLNKEVVDNKKLFTQLLENIPLTIPELKDDIEKNNQLFKEIQEKERNILETTRKMKDLIEMFHQYQKNKKENRKLAEKFIKGFMSIKID